MALISDSFEQVGFSLFIVPLIQRFPLFIIWPSLILRKNINACIIIIKLGNFKMVWKLESQGILEFGQGKI